MPDGDNFNLERFVQAQEPVIAVALEELKAGRKRTHWMWFVFPQLRGLGSSAAATFFGIGSLEEARAYLVHPLLGARLVRCTETVLAADAPSIHALFGSPDDMKFCSSMTLFALASGTADNPFQRAIARFRDGRMDQRTLALLREGGSALV